MQILIVGFQRSGTTLLRRILQTHPDIRQMFHEQFLLRACNNKNELIQFVDSKGINPFIENWGEKAPFYPNVRGISAIDYCRRWKRYFGQNGRILHIVRHPIDVALSVVKKRGKGGVEHPLRLYKSIMRLNISKIQNIKNSFTFKYEDMLLNPDVMIPKIYECCGVDMNVDFRENLMALENPKYQNLDPSRVFAYKNNPPDIDIKLDGVYDFINKRVGGVEYES